MCLARIGFNTNHAINAAPAFNALATINTAYQSPVAVVSSADSETSKDAVPFAVHNKPAFAVATLPPNVSAQVDWSSE